jgi:hypothetical protein
MKGLSQAMYREDGTSEVLVSIMRTAVMIRSEQQQQVV